MPMGGASGFPLVRYPKRMYQDQCVVVIMPAYNAAKTLRQTYDDVIRHEMVDLVIVVDDGSHDETARIAAELPRTKLIVHPQNLGYGANQKTCYRMALEEGADVIIMVHPDYQYTPDLIPAMVSLVASGLYPCVLGSRILGGKALAGGMPLWRYVSNRVLTLLGNWLMATKVSEFHTGYRAYSRELLEQLPLAENSNDFVFDNQVLAQVLWFGHVIGEISCPTRYSPESSSIGFWRSVRYGLGCVSVGVVYRLARWGWIESHLFPKQ